MTTLPRSPPPTSISSWGPLMTMYLTLLRGIVSSSLLLSSIARARTTGSLKSINSVSAASTSPSRNVRRTSGTVDRLHVQGLSPDRAAGGRALSRRSGAPPGGSGSPTAPGTPPRRAPRRGDAAQSAKILGRDGSPRPHPQTRRGDRSPAGDQPSRASRGRIHRPAAAEIFLLRLGRALSKLAQLLPRLPYAPRAHSSRIHHH